MESDLLEISGEDDSLLQQIPNDDISGFNSSRTYFACSPLQIARSNPSSHLPFCSPIEVRSCSKNAEKSSSSSVRDSVNKENINMNKSEVLKLSLEPQQMKRKKKGGGYNLRKSLAWDRAFFTEEGVLNPLELSMISGNSSQSGGEMLSVIHEERRESLSSLDCASDSADLQVLEENLFKELPESTTNKDKKVAGGLLSKNDSLSRDNVAPVSLAKRKVLSAHDVNRSGSKRSGCPRPIASSSLKRPANVITTKAVNKELKVSKIPVSKPDPCVLANTAKRVIPIASKSKQTQTVQPAVNVQKNFGFTASSYDTRSSRKETKSGPASKSSIPKSSFQQARRNVVSSTSEINSSTNLHRPMTKTKNGFKVKSDPTLRAAGRASNGHNADSSNAAVSLPQNTCHIGVSMHGAHLQTAKPSGLRMPSPSLGFFGQSKISASQGSFQRSTQASNCIQSNIPDLKKLGASNSICERPPPAAGKVPEVVNDVGTIGNMRVSGSSTGCSTLSAVYPASHEKMKSNMQNDILKVDLRVPYNPNSYEFTNNQQQSHGIDDDADQQSLDHAEPCKVEKTFCVEDKELQCNDNKLLLRCGPCEQGKKDDDNDDMRINDVSPKLRDLSRPELENSHFSSHMSPAVQVKCVSGTNDLIGDQLLEGKQYDSLMENQRFVSELQSDNAHFSDGELERSNGLYYSEVKEQAKDGASDIDDLSGKLYLGDAQVQSLDGNLSFECRNIILNTSDLDNQYEKVTNDATEKFGEEPEHPNPCLVADQVFQDNYGLHLNGAKSLSSEGFKLGNLLQSVKFVAPRANESELKSSSALCLMPPARQDCGETGHVEDTASGSTNTLCGLDMGLHGQAISLEFDRMGKDRVTGTGTAYEIDTTNVFLNSGELSGGESEDPLITSQLIPSFQVNGGSGINDINEYEDIEEKQCSLLVKNHCAASDLQPGEGIHCSDQGALVVHINCLSDKQDVTGQSMEQTKLIQSYSLEVDKTSQEENQSPKAFHGLLYEKKIAYQESGKFDSGNAADVNAKVKGSPERGFGSQLEHIEQAHEDVAGVKSLVGNAQLQSLDGGESYLATSAVNNISTGVVDDSDEQPKEFLELQNSSLVVEQVSMCDQGELLANDVLPEESQERNALGSAFDISEQSDPFGSESNSFIICTLQAPVTQCGGVDVIEKAEYLPEDEFVVGPVETDMSVENLKCHVDMKFRHDSELSGLVVDQVSTCDQGEKFASNVLPEESHESCFGFSEQSDSYGSESDSSIVCTLLAPTTQSGGVDVNEKAEYLPEDDFVAGPVETDTSVENLKCHFDMKFRLDSELSGLVVEQLSMCDQGEQFASNVLPEELQERNAPGSALDISEQSDPYGSESNSSIVCTLLAPETQSGDVHVNEKAEHLPEDDFVAGHMETDASFENLKCHFDMKFRHNSELSGLIVEQVSICNQGEQFSSEVLPEESLERNAPESAFDISEQPDPYANKSNSSIVCTVVAPATQSGGVDVNEKAEYLPEYDFVAGHVETETSVENLKCHVDTKFRHNSDLSGLIVERVSMCDQGEQFSSDGLPEELLERNAPESALDISEQSDPYASKSNSSIVCILLAPASQSGGVDVNEKAKYLPEDDFVTGPVETDMSVENLKCHVDIKFRHDSKLCGLVVEQVPTCDQGEQFASNVFPVESQDINAPVSAFDISEQSDPYGNDSNSPVVCNLLASATQNGVDVNEKPEYLPEDDLVAGSVETDRSVENHQCHVDMKFWHESELSGQATYSELDSPLMDEDQVSEAVNTCNSKIFCSLNEESRLSIKTDQTLSMGDVIQCTNFNVLESNILPKEAEINISQSSGGPKSEMQHEPGHATYTSEDKEATIPLKAGSDKKPDTLVITPPPDAVPFSDEWLAAFEAAGEEILTLKSGAVQNSPPQDSLPEPGPWSPVKRKNQQGIGPFDCTKFSNTNTPPSFD